MGKAAYSIVNHTSVAVTDTPSVVVAAQNKARVYLLVQNAGNQTAFLRFDGQDAVAGTGLALPSGIAFEMTLTNGALTSNLITAITSNPAGTTLLVMECRN